MEIKDYVKQFLETYGTSGKAERVTCEESVNDHFSVRSFSKPSF